MIQLLKYMDKANTNICDFAVDTVEDINLLPTTTTMGSGDMKFTCPIGSTCIVGNEDNDILVYILFSSGWKKL